MPVKLDFQLDFRSGVPIYTQIAEELRRKIASGQLKPGDQLPTVRELATELRINFNTVSRAYRVLDEVRLISTQTGRGTYISEAPTEEAILQLKQKSLRELAQTYLEDAARMGFSAQEARAEVDRLCETGNHTGENA